MPGTTSCRSTRFISVLIGAVTFTVSIILSGTLGDYREAERLLIEGRDMKD